MREYKVTITDKRHLFSLARDPIYKQFLDLDLVVYYVDPETEEEVYMTKSVVNETVFTYDELLGKAIENTIADVNAASVVNICDCDDEWSFNPATVSPMPTGRYAMIRENIAAAVIEKDEILYELGKTFNVDYMLVRIINDNCVAVIPVTEDEDYVDLVYSLPAGISAKYVYDVKNKTMMFWRNYNRTKPVVRMTKDIIFKGVKIAEGVEVTASAWTKRDVYVKTDAGMLRLPRDSYEIAGGEQKAPDHNEPEAADDSATDETNGRLEEVVDTLEAIMADLSSDSTLMPGLEAAWSIVANL